ncbi:MAG: guanylate kinase [Elusimicrobiota bacterium]
MKKKGWLFILSAPSGAGKSTLARAIVQKHKDFVHSVSYTTRSPRPGEKQGIDYNFVSRAGFNSLIRAKALFEHELVHGQFYGTPKTAILRHLERGKNVILTIDVYGAMRIAKRFPQDTVLIFLLPPNKKAWIDRLRKRKEKDLALRLSRARAELHELTKYDYCVINDNIRHAVADFLAIARACELKRLKTSFGRDFLARR